MSERGRWYGEGYKAAQKRRTPDKPHPGLAAAKAVQEVPAGEERMAAALEFCRGWYDAP